jgi:hypothetical protein
VSGLRAPNVYYGSPPFSPRVEREVWVRGAMVVSILALVVLILVTTVVFVRPPSSLAAQPQLTVGMAENKSWFVVNLGAAVEAYQYKVIRLTINRSDESTNWTFRETAQETEAYNLHRWVPANVTFSMNVYFVDRQKNYFEYNVTAQAMRDADNQTVMVFTFPFEKDALDAKVSRTPPNDYRLGVPWRGTLK